MATTEQSRPGGEAVLRARLHWRSAQRDDRQVAQALYHGEEVDALHELSEAGLLDGTAGARPTGGPRTAPRFHPHRAGSLTVASL